MNYGDFIIMDVGADVGAALARRRAAGRTRGGSFETLSTDEILVSRPRDMPVSDYISIATTNDRQAAQDASRDPAKIVARNMPVTLIKPVRAADFGIAAAGDPVADARMAGASWGIADVLGPSPRDLDGAGVKVAVLDTGIDPDHAAFAPIRDTIVSKRRNFSDGEQNDVDGHGTHCAGTIFGRDVENVRIGVARGVTDVLIGKVLGDDGFGSTKWVLDALKWAHSEGANIISMSLGFDFPRMQKDLMTQGNPPELATSIALKAYRDNLRQFETLANLLMQENEDSPGTILVAAAGNESRRNLNPNFVIDVSLPAAAARGMVSVGATRPVGSERQAIAPFSNVNPQLSAPGVGIVSAALGGGMRSEDGTSMACPHVAGVAALWWGWMHARNQGQVRAADVASQLTATARDTIFEPGVTFGDRGAGAVLAPQQ
jgi:subtilisin family serine protease